MSQLGAAAGTGVPVDHRRWRRRLCGLAVSVVALLISVPAPTASAHAFLVASTPADGEVLDAAPAEIRFNFSESVNLDAMVVDIVDSENRHYRPTSISLAPDSDAPADTEEPAEIVAGLPPLAVDTYRIDWQTLSSDDLHRTSGTLVFGIGQTPTVAGFLEPVPRLEEMGLRAVIFVSLAAALGGLLAARLLDRAGDGGTGTKGPRRVEQTGRPARRLRHAAAVGAAAGLLACVALLVDQALAGGLTLVEVVWSGYGARFFVREVGFALLLVGAISLSSRRWPGTGRTASIVVGATLAGVGTALLGHSAANPVSAATRVAADTAHLLAAATWSGTLLLAVMVVLPLVRRRDGAAVGSMLRAFALPAVGCFAVMVVSGLYLASGVVGSIDALLLTFYGRTLLLKMALVGAIGILALVNTLALRDSARPRVPRRAIIAEAGAAVVVLALAATLTSSQPATEPEFVAAQQVATVPLRDAAVGDLQEALTIRPNAPGRNVLLVDVFDTRRPALAPIRSVLVGVVGADGATVAPVAADSLGDGRWSVTAELDRAVSTIEVTVRRPGQADVTSQYPWAMPQAAGLVREATVSNTPIGDYLTIAAGCLFAVLAGAAVGIGLVFRRRRIASGGGDVAVARRDLAASGVE